MTDEPVVNSKKSSTELQTHSLDQPINTYSDDGAIKKKDEHYNMKSRDGTLPTDGLVAYYPFTDGSTKDFSENGNDGVNHGATPTVDRFGNANGAMSFDGVDDWINLGNNKSIKPDRTISIVLWAKQIDPRKEQVLILNSQNGSTAGYAYGIRTNTSSTYFGVGNGTTPIGYHTEPMNNEWHQIIGIFDKGVLIYYLDGVIVHDSIIAKKHIRNTSVDVVLGYFPSFGQYFEGVLDDIRIYNHVLNPSEISALYHEGEWDMTDESGRESKESFPAIQTDLTGRWDFNTNQHFGSLDLNLNSSQLSGKAVLESSIDGTPYNQTFKIGDGIVYQSSQEIRIEFYKVGGERQKYIGWVSPDGKMISGYFVYGKKKRPWCAVR
jgi:hypothetical protein